MYVYVVANRGGVDVDTDSHVHDPNNCSPETEEVAEVEMMCPVDLALALDLDLALDHSLDRVHSH